MKFEERLFSYWNLSARMTSKIVAGRAATRDSSSVLNWANPDRRSDDTTGWLQGNHVVPRHEKSLSKNDYSFIRNFGENIMGNGYNASEYVAHVGNTISTHLDNDLLKKHISYHINRYISLTGKSIESLHFPKVCKLSGYTNSDSGDNVFIPYTAPRLGYYANTISEFYKSNNSDSSIRSIMEIGGGWGALCYLLKKNTENISSYVIVDIPTTISTAATFLNEAGMTVLFPSEVNPDTDFSSVDCVFLEKEQVSQLTDNFFDIIVCANCITELDTKLIDFYLKQSLRLSNFMYIDSPIQGNSGTYLRNKIRELKCKVETRRTPITPYYPPWTSTMDEKETFQEFCLTFNSFLRMYENE